MLSTTRAPSLVHTLLLPLWFNQATASSTFTPDCTLPPEHTNFVSSPNVRGSLSILWNCLSIIFLCTWSIQHLNIAAQRSIVAKDPWWFESTCPEGCKHNNKGIKCNRKLAIAFIAWLATKCLTIWWKILDSRTQLKWMTITVLAPEYIMGKAFSDRLAADYCLDMYMRNLGGGEPLELIHGYLANMGGYYIEIPAEGEEFPDPANPQDRAFEPNRELSSSNAEMADIQINWKPLQRHCWALTARQLSYAHDLRLFDRLPIISARDIEALDDSNTIVKLLAIAQVSWLVIQLIVRATRGLPSSQLEIAVLAFSVSSLVTYIVLWDRPRNITRRYKIAAQRRPTQRGAECMAQYGPSYLLQSHRRRDRVDNEYNVIPIPNDAMYPRYVITNRREMLNLVFGAVFGGVVFGGLHCLAWNFYFPTPIEALLWRICSVLTASLPIMAVGPLWLFVNDTDRWLANQSRRRHIVGVLFIAIFVIPYLLARLFILVEIFRSLFFLPSEAFRETWSGAFPNYGG